MRTSAAAARNPAVTHIHRAGEVCPWCEQPIPHDKFAEISARIAERERAQFASLSAALKEQHAREKAQLEAAAKVTADQAREEARVAAEAAAQERLADLERGRAEAEAALHARIAEAEESGADLRAQLEEVQRNHATALQQILDEAGDREALIREEARAAAETAVGDRLAAAEQARAEAEAALRMRTALAERQLQDLRDAQAAEIDRRLREQREALEQDKVAAVNAEKARVFEENLRLSETVQQLQRKLDAKLAEELSEGADIDLVDALKAEFHGDRIKRLHNKGPLGADIRHVVIHNGQECGSIVYGSKARHVWRSEYVMRLAQDQMAAKADHAILATHKFPAGTRQLFLQDGVIVASPARVIPVVQLVRQHIIQAHLARMSAAERAEKTDALYEFITSERCYQLFARIDAEAQKMLDLQEKEIRAHKITWERQGALYRSVQKLKGDLCFEIGRITGTAEQGLDLR